MFIKRNEIAKELRLNLPQFPARYNKRHYRTKSKIHLNFSSIKTYKSSVKFQLVATQHIGRYTEAVFSRRLHYTELLFEKYLNAITYRLYKNIPIVGVR